MLLYVVWLHHPFLLLLALSLFIFFFQNGQEVDSEYMNNTKKRERKCSPMQSSVWSTCEEGDKVCSYCSTCIDPVRSIASVALTPVSLWLKRDTQISFLLEASVLQSTKRYFPHLCLYTYITIHCVWDIKITTRQIHLVTDSDVQRFKSRKLQFHLLNPCWLQLHGPISCPVWLYFFLIWVWGWIFLQKQSELKIFLRSWNELCIIID